MIAGVCVTTFLVACGGSTPEAKEPESSAEATASSTEPGDTGKATDDKEGSTDDTSKDVESASSSSKSGAKDAEKKALRSAKDVITRQDVLFMFSFAASEPHQTAEKKCAEKSKDDPKKKADCMTKAGKDFESDGMAFTEGEGGTFFWLTVRRKGGALAVLHKVEVELEGDGEKQVTIKTRGPDKGSKPGGLPKELVIEVPSETEIAVNDPKRGRLVYEAKMGLLGKNDR